MTERDGSSERVADADDGRSRSTSGDPVPKPRIAGEPRETETDSDGDDEREPEFFRAPIEPEDPAAENALFVALGVVGTVLLFVSAVAPGLI